MHQVHHLNLEISQAQTATLTNFDGALLRDKQNNWTILVVAMHFLNECIMI